MTSPKDALEDILACFYEGIGFEWNKIKQIDSVQGAIAEAKAAILVAELHEQLVADLKVLMYGVLNGQESRDVIEGRIDENFDKLKALK